MDLVHKVTLTTGKVIFLHQMDQGKEELALKAADMKGGSSEALISYHMVGELSKILIAGVEKNGAQVPLSGSELELYYKEMTYPEVKQLRNAVTQIMGNDQDAKPIVELASGGPQ